jgi:hypothetical protein
VAVGWLQHHIVEGKSFRYHLRNHRISSILTSAPTDLAEAFIYRYLS